MDDYRVSLDVYNGPLDLLLYLIRREEVDIYDIPIARITEQYLQYVEMLKAMDPNLAGEFLVLAASLIEIKTRMLLPPAEAAEEDGEGGLGIDPRAELVRQLLEYKAFKDAAADLGEAAEMQARRFPRKPHTPDLEAQVDLEDIQIWDLVDAFGRVLAAIGAANRQHEVIYDDTPIELHADDILDRLRREGDLTFSEIFAGRSTRSEVIGLFLALLELVRTRRIHAVQDRTFGEIRLTPTDPGVYLAPGEDTGASEEMSEETSESAPNSDSPEGAPPHDDHPREDS